MKKISTLLATITLAIGGVNAYAAPTIIEVNPLDGDKNAKTSIEANTVITDNEFITVTTIYNTAGGKTSDKYIFGDVNLTNTGWIEVRSKTPDAANPFGAADGTSTSLKVEVKKPVTLYSYIRTGNNKEKAVKAFNSSFEVMPYVNGEEGKNCGADGTKNVLWEFSWTLDKGTYCVTEISGTGRLAALGYEEATIEEPEVPVEGTAFTVEGYGGNTWGVTFDDVVTPFTFDKSTMTATFDNFVGSSANFSIKYTLADPTKDPTMTGTRFNSVPVSGLSDGDETTGCTINDFNGPIELKQNGVVVGKLENIKFWPSYNSQVSIESTGAGDNIQKYYELKVMFGGTYYAWDSATSDWVNKGNEYIYLVDNIPFEDGDQSGIEDIVTDNVDENAPVEYYNLQGIRLSEPAAGQIVIRRQGSKVSKILVK